VLIVAHNHPELVAGGAEIYSSELYQALRRSGRAQPTLLAASALPERERLPFRVVDGDPNQLLWSVTEHDFFYLTSTAKEHYTRDLPSLLAERRPDVVHIQHLGGLGLDVVTAVRRTLPHAPIVYSLHEFQMICNSQGLMTRPDGSLCERSSPLRCSRCFPQRTPTEFFLRERFVKARLEPVDLFLAPSRFLRRVFVDWGIEEDRIVWAPQGRTLQAPADTAGDAGELVRRFGFFGQLQRHKGLLVLLEAAALLETAGRTDLRLVISGDNLRFADGPFREEYERRLRASKLVIERGAYGRNEVADRMAAVGWVVVPSLWWENAPLVIQEAYAHGRPVIASGIGGMAELVEHDVSGLHVRVGDAAHLASTLERCSRSPELWQRLRRSLPAVPTLQATVEQHLTLYHSLVARRERRAS
jgi:glycosyltransferase involved in cell wall biosynthesis